MGCTGASRKTLAHRSSVPNLATTNDFRSLTEKQKQQEDLQTLGPITKEYFQHHLLEPMCSNNTNLWPLIEPQPKSDKKDRITTRNQFFAHSQ